MPNPINELAELNTLLNTPNLGSLVVKVVIRGQVQVEAIGPGPLDRVKVLIVPQSSQDLLQWAPQSWWLGAPSLVSAVANGWLEVVTPASSIQNSVIQTTTYIPQPLNPQIGDLLVFDGNGWVLLPVGPSGEVLTSNGPGFLPSYEPGGGGGGGATTTILLTATLGVQVGDAVYMSGISTVDRANAATTPHAIGIVQEMPTSTSARVVLAGRTDTIFGGLIPGTLYYVSTTSGLITTAAPTNTGEYVQTVGTAETSTVLLVQLGDSIIL